jgi:hypothetical protein
VLDVWHSIRDGRELDGCAITAHLTGSLIPRSLQKPRIPERGVDGRPAQVSVSMKDTDSGEVERFSSMADAARRHRTSPSHITQCVSRSGKIRLFKKKYLVVVGDAPFPEVAEDALVKLKSTRGRQVIAYNSDTAKTWSFQDAASFIRLFGLSKKAVTTRLARDGSGTLGPWTFAYRENLNDFHAKIKGFQSQTAPP